MIIFGMTLILTLQRFSTNYKLSQCKHKLKYLTDSKQNNPIVFMSISTQVQSGMTRCNQSLHY